MSSVTGKRNNAPLDPYTADALQNDVTPQEKISGLKAIIKAAGTGMLVTRSSDGELHSRAMTPASNNSGNSEIQLSLFFIGNNASDKFDQLEQDPHVNVSFYDLKTTNWASYSGTARIRKEKDLIKQFWSSTTAGYFGDLHDGVHKGDENDPRVALIEVIPNEIRYYTASHGKLINSISNAASAATGRVSAPGNIRVISKQEIQLTEGLHTK